MYPVGAGDFILRGQVWLTVHSQGKPPERKLQDSPFTLSVFLLYYLGKQQHPETN